MVIPPTNIGPRLWQRAAIASLHVSGIDEQATAAFLDCHLDTVNRWLSRVETGHGIHDHARSGRPPMLDQGIQLRTIAFYCQKSPLPGYSSWSLRDAEKYLKGDPAIVGTTVSRSSISRILNAHAMRPHLYKYCKRSRGVPKSASALRLRSLAAQNASARKSRGFCPQGKRI